MGIDKHTTSTMNNFHFEYMYAQYNVNAYI